MLARPLTSLCTVLWLELKMTGDPVGVMPTSPVVPPLLFPAGRITVD
jgi:hypothetical protein